MYFCLPLPLLSFPLLPIHIPVHLRLVLPRDPIHHAPIDQTPSVALVLVHNNTPALRASNSILDPVLEEVTVHSRRVDDLVRAGEEERDASQGGKVQR